MADRIDIIPPPALEQHLAILGKTGSGKTTTAKAAIEGVLDRGGRVCIVDPTGVWWGLRLATDGVSASGLEVVIFGGRHADLPLDPSKGEQVAEIIGTTSTAAVLDTSQLTVGQRTRFFTDFAGSLVRANRGVLHLVVDEAHLFAPQGRVADPQSAGMVHAANNLVSLGRSRGLRITLITQRPAKLHKDSLTQVETLVALRLVAPQDRRAVEDWIVGQADKATGADVMASLASLPTGEGWVWSPEIGVLERVKFARPRTFDSSRAGNDDIGVLPAIDVAALAAVLAAPTSDGTQGAQLQRKAAPPDEIAAAERRGYERGYAEGRAAGLRDGENAIRALSATGSNDGASEPPRPAEPAKVTIDPSTGHRPADAGVISDQRRKERYRAEFDVILNSAGRKMLAVLDTEPPVRRSWQAIATLVGLRARGGHFNAGRKGLLDLALVSESGGLVWITRPSTSARPAQINPAALVETWAANLSGAAPRILRHLFAVGRQSRATVADALGLKARGGHWNAAWKELRDNYLVVVDEGDVAELADELKPEARHVG